MSSIILQVTMSDSKNVTTLKTVGTAWEDIDISSLVVTIYGEDKVNPIYSYILTDSQIESIQDTTDGLQVNTELLIPDYISADGFYIIGLSCNQSDDTIILSNTLGIGFIAAVTNIFKTTTLDVVWQQVNNLRNNTADDMMLNISQCNGHFILEYLELFSTLADYGYDREVGWRKLYKVLNTYYGS